MISDEELGTRLRKKYKILEPSCNSYLDKVRNLLVVKRSFQCVLQRGERALSGSPALVGSNHYCVFNRSEMRIAAYYFCICRCGGGVDYRVSDWPVVNFLFHQEVCLSSLSSHGLVYVNHQGSCSDEFQGLVHLFYCSSS